MSEKRIKIFITIAALIFAIMVIIFVVANNFDNVESTSIKNEKVNSKNSKYEKYEGIIVEIDETNTKYTVRDYDNTQEIEFEYKTGCEIKNIYGKDIYHDKLKIGDVVVIGYDDKISNLKYIHVDSRIMQYKELKKYDLNTDTYYIELDDTKYRLTKETYVYYKNHNYTIYDINENDVLTLNIKDKDIISVVVEQGHGNITLKNHDSFIGYNLIVNDDKSYEIKKETKITVPEGKNIFTIKNDKLTGSVTLNVIGGYDRVIDVRKIQFEKKKEGKVTFYIEPNNARLYINGKSYNYEEDIVLDYGTYRYVVESAGYYASKSTMTIDSESKTISVHLYKDVSTDAPENTKSSEQTDATDAVTTSTPAASASAHVTATAGN